MDQGATGPTPLLIVLTLLTVPAATAFVAATGPLAPALDPWTAAAAGPSAFLDAVEAHPEKVPPELFERLQYASEDGLLGVLGTLTHRGPGVDAFMAASTSYLYWYGDAPRFYAHVTPDQYATLLDDGRVVFVEPDYPLTYFLSTSTIDVHARGSSAGANNGVWAYDPSAGPLGALVSDHPSFTTPITGKGVAVAIIDSGIDRTNRDFGGWDCEPTPYLPCESRILAAAKAHVFFHSELPIPTTEVASGHGTHVSGIVAGNGYYGRDWGQSSVHMGVAPEAGLVVISNGDSQSAALATGALQYNLQQVNRYGIRASSNSWGCLGGCSYSAGSATSQVVRDLYEAGVVVVFAVGNDGGSGDGDNFSGFAQSPYVLAVASYNDGSDHVSSFSSRGSSSAPLPDPTTWTPASEGALGARRPDVAAPGESITAPRTLTGGTSTLVPRVNTADVTGGPGTGISAYVGLTGTSMATPHVSGAVALLAQACPDASALDLMRAIMVGADGAKVKQSGGLPADPYQVGYGALDVRASLDWLITQPACV